MDEKVFQSRTTLFSTSRGMNIHNYGRNLYIEKYISTLSSHIKLYPYGKGCVVRMKSRDTYTSERPGKAQWIFGTSKFTDEDHKRIQEVRKQGAACVAEFPASKK